MSAAANLIANLLMLSLIYSLHRSMQALERRIARIEVLATELAKLELVKAKIES